MKVAICLLALVGTVFAEPPVPSNRYLPGNSGNGISYANGNGHHHGNGNGHHHGNGNGHHHGNGFSAPSAQYGAPSAQYGAPSAQYGAPQNGNNNGFDNGFGNGAPSAQYGAPSAQYGALSQQYGAPSNGFHGFAHGANSHHHSNGVHSNGHNGLTAAIIRPSSQYGAPASRYGAPKSVYGAPNGGYEDQAPASYQFEYAVEDAKSGNDFGHQEAREGDVAMGRYYVTLPDGRKQTVEYTADSEGYKPMISYVDVNGGGRNGNGNGGYRY